MTAEHEALLGELRAVLAADPRVRSLWLSGSLGRGEGDAWSDIDLTVVAEAADLPALIADFHRPRQDMPPQVFSQLVHGRIVSAITPDWMRFDIAFVTPTEFAVQDGASLRRLAGDLDEAPPPRERRRDAGSPTRVLAIAHEFIRILGLLPVAVARQEWIVAQQGFGLLRQLTVDLFLEETALPPGARGVKRLNAFLTDDQRAALEAIAPPAADEAAIIAANRAIAALFLPRARRLAADLGLDWPEAFEAATRKRLHIDLGLDV
jgi:predicted nucleotidyltransferase